MPFKNPHPLYSTWQGMKARCYNPKYRQFKDYGGRGISVCDRWIVPYQGFHNFVSDMGEKPDGKSLDRIDNDAGYSPENCKWSTRKEQQRNQTNTRKIVVEGVEYIAADLADKSGLKVDSVVERAKHDLTMKEILDPTKRVFTKGLALGGKANGARQKAKTHCVNGHEYSPKNTYISKEGWRRCRACRRK